MDSNYYYRVFEDLNNLNEFDTIINIVESLQKHVFPDAFWSNVLASGYFKAKQYKKAQEWTQRSLEITSSMEQKYLCRGNLSMVYLYLNEPEKSLKVADINLKIKPDDCGLKLNRAVALYAMNQKEESLILLNELIQDLSTSEKDKLKCLYNLGNHYMNHGDFVNGMIHCQIGRQLGVWGSKTHNYPIPLWDGITRLGSSILFVGEGGIGDEVINARFVKYIRDRGMVPHITSCHGITTPYLRMGFETASSYTKFTTKIENIEKFDYWIPIMDAPLFLQLNFPDLWFGPYITVDLEYNKKWRSILEPNDKIKIGIKWSGNPLYEQELHRTIPINDVLEVMNNDDFEIISLQKDDNRAISDRSDIIKLEDKLDTIEDLIAAIAQIDVVITSCTSVAHIAGAMGKITYVFVPIMNYYVWPGEANTSPWYDDHVRILRQSVVRSWKEPIEVLADHLKYL